MPVSHRIADSTRSQWTTWSRNPIQRNPRPQSPAIVAAARALYGGPGEKQRIQREQGVNYPAWVLDQIGADVMLANRVAMGKSIQPPRFRWVPYARP